MSDLRVITILPTQPVSAVTHSQTSSGNQTGQVAASNLPVGSVLSGFIINRDNNGNPILRTNQGDITFASNFFLKIGSEVTIRIEHSSGGNLAHILSVNGQEPEIAVKQSGFANEPDIIIGDNSKNNDAGNIATYNKNISGKAIQEQTESHNIRQTMIKGFFSLTEKSQLSTAAATLPLPSLKIENNSQLILKIATITPPPTENISKPTAEGAKNNLPQSYMQTNTEVKNISQPMNHNIENDNISGKLIQEQNPNNKPSDIRQTQTEGTNKLPSLQTPQENANKPPYNNATITTEKSAGNITGVIENEGKQISLQTTETKPHITATIAGKLQTGETILHTQTGIIRLQTKSPIPFPQGSIIGFEVVEINEQGVLENNSASTITNATVSASSPAPLTQLARNAGALNNIFILLSGIGGSSSDKFIQTTIPSTVTPQNNIHSPEQQPKNHNIIAPLLNFISALKNRDFRSFLGNDNVRWLENNGHENLLKKAEGEFLSIARQFTEPSAHNWQSLFFPIAVDGELQQIRFFIKRDRKQKEKEGKNVKEEDTRFVLEMDLSQLGEMQMDGFVRRSSENKENIRFDLIIRSHQELPVNIQQEISYIYNDIGELTGYRGSIIFQTGDNFPVNPMEEIAADNHQTFIV